jgi:hypothetical protein
MPSSVADIGHQGTAEADGERAAQLAFGGRTQDETEDGRDRKIEPAHQKAQHAIALDHIAERPHAWKFESDD